MARIHGDTGIKEIVKIISKLGEKHSNWRVFEDFLAMIAISISNSVDKIQWDKREKQYLDIVKPYNREELELFCEMYAILVAQLDLHADEPQDVLGPIFHELELHNKYNGQFFSPVSICDMMGKMTFSKSDKNFEKKGYITLYEPCSGSGAMVLGFVKAMAQSKCNFRTQVVVTATDIDIKCVYMTYIQLSLYGIPAVVIHGNTLTVEEWSRWYTPVYILDEWVWRQSCGTLDKQYPEDELIKRASSPTYAALQMLKAIENKVIPIEHENPPREELIEKEPIVPVYDVELKENKLGQLSLF